MVLVSNIQSVFSCNVHHLKPSDLCDFISSAFYGYPCVQVFPTVDTLTAEMIEMIVDYCPEGVLSPRAEETDAELANGRTGHAIKLARENKNAKEYLPCPIST